MQEKINSLLQDVETYIPSGREDIERFRIQYLGRKGLLATLFSEFKTVDPKRKKEMGRLLNVLKDKVEEKIERYMKTMPASNGHNPSMDMTLPAYPIIVGTRHPLSLVRKEIFEIFSCIGFTISEGPEVENDWYNFGALNFPEEHPARDMQDTFFIEKDPDIVLRTHTSSVQVRVMENTPPPIRSISPGRVYRNEAVSARAHCIFHQVEGLYIDENVSFADLKQTLLYFAREMFGEKTETRLRPSFFPFTEPSAEMDISCNICKGEGCNVCKHSGWVEILGCGMVDPNVLVNCSIDSKKYTGFAFGMGIERIALLKYKINDLRIFYENDIRFLNQFASMA